MRHYDLADPTDQDDHGSEVEDGGVGGAHRPPDYRDGGRRRRSARSRARSKRDKQSGGMVRSRSRRRRLRRGFWGRERAELPSGSDSDGLTAGRPALTAAQKEAARAAEHWQDVEAGAAAGDARASGASMSGGASGGSRGVSRPSSVTGPAPDAEPRNGVVSSDSGDSGLDSDLGWYTRQRRHQMRVKRGLSPAQLEPGDGPQDNQGLLRVVSAAGIAMEWMNSVLTPSGDGDAGPGFQGARRSSRSRTRSVVRNGGARQYELVARAASTTAESDGSGTGATPVASSSGTAGRPPLSRPHAAGGAAADASAAAAHVAAPAGVDGGGIADPAAPHRRGRGNRRRSRRRGQRALRPGGKDDDENAGGEGDDALEEVLAYDGGAAARPVSPVDVLRRGDEAAADKQERRNSDDGGTKPRGMRLPALHHGAGARAGRRRAGSG